MPEAKHFYEFGPFRLDPAERSLLCDKEAIPLTPKAFETLLLLVEYSGHLLTKDELMKRLWPDTFVEEVNLAQNISAIRRALHDKNGGLHYVETVAKGGYRFTAETRKILYEPPRTPTQDAEPVAGPVLDLVVHRWPVTRLAVIASATILVIAIALLFIPRIVNFRAKGTSAASAATAIRSVAVLPLVNLSSDPEQEYFSDGMTDELIAELAKVGRLRVISHTSVQRYKETKRPLPEIARELSVDAVVEGTVMRSGDRVRITAQLIDARSDRHLWAESYERDLREVLALQDEVAQVVEQAVDRFGRIDTYVANAIVTVYAETYRYEPEELRRVLDVNFYGQVYGYWAALPHLRESRGTFLSINSALAYRGIPLQGAYCASNMSVGWEYRLP